MNHGNTKSDANKHNSNVYLTHVTDYPNSNMANKIQKTQNTVLVEADKTPSEDL